MADRNGFVPISDEEWTTDDTIDSDIDDSGGRNITDIPRVRKRRKIGSTGQNNSSLRRKCRRQMMQKFSQLRTAEVLTDCLIAVDGSPDIPVHKIVLAAASTFFATMFRSGMRESLSDKVNLGGVSYETAQFIVEFAYCGKYEITAENAQNVLEAADCYQFNLLKDNCESFLLNTVDESNCFALMKIADIRRLPRLSSATLSFALGNFDKICQTPFFLEVSETVLQKYLSDDELFCRREEDVYSALVSWLTHSPERTQFAPQLLKCVRLGNVSPRFLLDVVSDEAIFTEEESKKYIHDARRYKMLSINDRLNEDESLGRPRVCSGVSQVMVCVGGISGNRKLNDVYGLRRPIPSDSKAIGDQTWAVMGSISTSHHKLHSYSVSAYDNDIYITGGHCSDASLGLTVDLVSLYQSGSKTWMELPKMNSTRERHGSSFVDGYLYVVGGLMAGKQRRRPAVLCGVERFNTRFRFWESVADLPKKCYSPGVISYDEKLYVIGGVSMIESGQAKPSPAQKSFSGSQGQPPTWAESTLGTQTTHSGSGSSKTELAIVQVYSPRTDSWTIHEIERKLARLSCALYKKYIYIISNNEKSIFRYCPTTHALEEWLELDRLSEKLEFAGFIAHRGKLFISGGQQKEATLDQMTVVDIATKTVDSQYFKLPKPMCMHGCVIIEQYKCRLTNRRQQSQKISC